MLRFQEVSKEAPIKSTMNRVADKNGMIARRATPVVVILRYQGAQHSERPFLLQPMRALALRAVCGVRLRHVTAQQPIAGAAACNPLPHQTLPRTVSGVLLLAKGIAIRVVTFLASSPADTLLRSSRLREAGRGRHSRTIGLRPPCHAAYPAKPSARPCGT